LSLFTASCPDEIYIQHIGATHKTFQDWMAVLKCALPHLLPEDDTGFSEMKKKKKKILSRLIKLMPH
jgi:hypothetical protein